MNRNSREWVAVTESLIPYSIITDALSCTTCGVSALSAMDMYADPLSARETSKRLRRGRDEEEGDSSKRLLSPEQKQFTSQCCSLPSSSSSFPDHLSLFSVLTLILTANILFSHIFRVYLSLYVCICETKTKERILKHLFLSWDSNMHRTDPFTALLISLSGKCRGRKKKK